MIRPNKKHTIGALLGLGLAVLLIWGVDNDPKPQYWHNEGHVFGTYYNIRYEATADLEDSIQAAFKDFDNSLSMFNPHSILSAVNANRDTTTNAAFETMFDEAARVYALSNGAFDITVAPLVKAFGFGKKSDQFSEISIQTIDSLREFVGFDKVQLVNHKVIKFDQRVQLDAGAVAKGQACDMIADVLRKNGCENYLVDIGGEVVAHGVNAKGEPWHVGITKPNLNNEGAQEDLQEILAVSDICMATSGNYRNYYYADGERRSHTIDPRTGYPVQHSVLSATVVSSSCMRADALATACMVLGADKAMEMIERAQDAACYLIVAQNDSLVVLQSQKWSDFVQK
ncbi:MAG: FAD:protein FMN transferase [Paludibacteraceae bacterium]|nr:FAD:protein FMN transferase [Paludibacteraceae bacterium]